jgi:APA family basic amino acid/polyamine antiporter
MGAEVISQMLESTNIKFASKGLPGVFSFHHYLSLSMGYAIGLGWIFVPARMLNRGGPLGILIAIVLSGLLLWFIARCYARMVERHPVVGGEIVWALKSFGNGASFSVFWLLLLGFLSYLLFYTSFSGMIFEKFAPGTVSDVLYRIEDSEFKWSSILPGLSVGAFVIFINLKSTSLAIAVQSMAVFILILLVVVVGMVAFANGDLSNFEPLFEGSGAIPEVGQILFVVAGMICWYLFGFSTIAQCAAEAKPHVTTQQTGKAITLSLVLVTIFYLFVHLFVIAALPWSETTKQVMPTAEVLKLAFGYDWAYQTILIAGMLGIVTTLNACVICCVRSILAAVRAGFLPDWFGQIHESSGVPRNAIIFTGMVAALGPFLSLSWLASDLGPMSFLCAFLFTSAAVLKHDQNHAVSTYIAISISAIMVLSMLVPGAYYQVKWPSGFVFLFGCAVLGFLLYRLRLSHMDPGS